MTLLTAERPRTAGPAPSSGHLAGSELRVTQLRVLRSEWIKLRSLRSTAWTLAIGIALMIGLGAVFSAVAASQPGGFGPDSSAISTSLTGTFFAQLALGVMGVLMITGEYSTGMVRSSFAVVPRRLPVLWAKLVLAGSVVFATMLGASLAAFLAGQAVLTGKGMGVALTHPAALRSVVGAALYLTVATMTAVALGALVRSTAGAITIFVATFFVVPPLLNLLPAAWTAHFVQYLPSLGGAVMIDGSSYGIAHPLPPWTGLAVMCLPPLLLTLAAGWRLGRRDA